MLLAVFARCLPRPFSTPSQAALARTPHRAPYLKRGIQGVIEGQNEVHCSLRLQAQRERRVDGKASIHQVQTVPHGSELVGEGVRVRICKKTNACSLQQPSSLRTGNAPLLSVLLFLQPRGLPPQPPACLPAQSSQSFPH